MPGASPGATAAAPAAAAAAGPAADPLDEIYAGAKAPLRALHEHITALVDGFGPHEKAPKKATVSLRRKKQFALLGPATKTHLEIGINHKALPADPRLKVMPPGSMCPYTLRVASADEVDADVQRWLRAAYDAAADSTRHRRPHGPGCARWRAAGEGRINTG